MEHLNDALRHLGQAIEALYRHGEEHGDTTTLSLCRNRVNRALRQTAEYARKTKDNHAEPDRSELYREISGSRGTETDPA